MNLQITRGLTGSATSDLSWFVVQFGTAKRFSYMKTIPVQAGRVVSGPHADFPFLFNSTDAGLRTVANGGHVTSDHGYDIIFRATSDTTCGGAGTAPFTLSHEIEKYDGATGQLISWVNLPSITNGTVFFIYYGNSDIVTSLEDPAGVQQPVFAGGLLFPLRQAWRFL
jgi:MSHA biogenesis protein MshQ